MSVATEVTADVEYGYVGDIAKFTEEADGTLMVYGVASSPRTDLDGQQCDPAWLKQAMPEWFSSGGNVREQHSQVAAGVGKTLEHTDGDQWWLKSHVVDPTSIAKVKAGVLKGYSIGVRGGRVARGKSVSAPGGVIVGGKIVEVSLVDRPCNPDSTITICKAAPGSDVMEFTDIEDEDDVPELETDLIEEADAPSLFDYAEESEESSQGVDGAVDKAAAADPDASHEWAALGGESPVMITKGLLETLIHGPKDTKHKRDGHGKFSSTNTLSAQRKALRARHAMERSEARKHRQASDAEHLQDAQNAQHAGRAQEAGEHRARLGSYDKSLSARHADEAIFSTELTVAEWKHGMDLLRQIQDGDLVSGEVITKGERTVYDESDDVERSKNIIAELAELVISEAEELANGRFEEVGDLRNLLEVIEGMVRFCRAEEYQGGMRDGARLHTEQETLVHKSAGLFDDDTSIEWDDETPALAAPVLDAPVASTATVVDAEIVKTMIAEATRAQEAELATLRAQLDGIRRMPIPGGPIANVAIMKSLMPAPTALPASDHASPAYWEGLARRDGLTPETRHAYEAKARELREG